MHEAVGHHADPHAEVECPAAARILARAADLLAGLGPIPHTRTLGAPTRARRGVGQITVR